LTFFHRRAESVRQVHAATTKKAWLGINQLGEREECMKFRHGWLLNTAAIAVIVWMTGNAAFAQSKTQNLPATFTMIGNGSNGVVVRDLSFAKFSTSNVTGNLSGTDVNCKPQFPATRGALTDIGGGTTNCVEP
jgi:hypothetical protein